VNVAGVCGWGGGAEEKYVQDCDGKSLKKVVIFEKLGV
jgi:hypothetical protein